MSCLSLKTLIGPAMSVNEQIKGSGVHTNEAPIESQIEASESVTPSSGVNSLSTVPVDSLTANLSPAAGVLNPLMLTYLHINNIAHANSNIINPVVNPIQEMLTKVIGLSNKNPSNLPQPEQHYDNSSLYTHPKTDTEPLIKSEKETSSIVNQTTHESITTEEDVLQHLRGKDLVVSRISTASDNECEENANGEADKCLLHSSVKINEATKDSMPGEVSNVL